MTFKASKLRIRQPARPVGEGTPIVPSAALAKWYADKISVINDAMIKDYREEMEKALTSDTAEEFYAQDASISSLFKKVLKKLEKKWALVFEGFAAKMAPEFVDKAEQQATVTTLFSLKTAGIKEPKATYNAAVKETLKASVDYNHTLITNIAQESHEKIYNSVMLSLTSPNPEEQGMGGIKKALVEIGITNKKRIKLITTDQTAKLYCSLATERMEENGVDEFEWMHSSAGKVPRKTHVEKNGKIFKINDPRLWTGPKGDQGPPGWAINCRCRMRPII